MDPSSLEAYTEVFTKNLEVFRTGGEIIVHTPCPFCAAPDWWVARLDEFAQASTSIYCIGCGRSAAYSSDGDTVELRQTAGPPAPDWSALSQKARLEEGNEGFLQKPREAHPRRLPRRKRTVSTRKPIKKAKKT